jgi:hypothetical protein
MFDESSSMEASGQYIQQIWHREHFEVSMIGRNVRQEPVFPVLPTCGRESGVIGKSLILLGAFAIDVSPR